MNKKDHDFNRKVPDLDIKELFSLATQAKIKGNSLEVSRTKRQWANMGISLNWPETNTEIKIGNTVYKVGSYGDFIKLENFDAVQARRTKDT